MGNEKEIVEINGCKFEVDLSTAKKIVNFSVGDNIKVLKKTYDTYESFVGVIVGFDFFKERPAVNLAYLERSYNNVGIKFLTYTKDSEDVEIAPLTNPKELEFDKVEVISRFDKEIQKKKDELKDIENKKSYFIDSFSKSFENLVK